MSDSVGAGFPTTGIQRGHTFFDLDTRELYVLTGADPRIADNWEVVQVGAVSSSSDNGGSGGALYDYQTSIELQDDFLTGGTTTGTIGVLGWAFTNGTAANVASTQNNPGILRRSTSGAINQAAWLGLNLGPTEQLHSGNDHSIACVVAAETFDNQTTIRLGMANTMNTSAPTFGIYFEKLAADTNWFCVTRDSGIETRSDSGVAVAGTFESFSYVKTSGNVVFSINGNIVATHTTNIPSQGCTVGGHVLAISAVVRSMLYDYFELQSTLPSRV